jgi:hypothetical protein
MPKTNTTISLIITFFIFIILTLLSNIYTAFIMSFGTYYYFFWNGYFLYRLNYPKEELGIIQAFTYSLTLSFCLNSLSLYLLNRYFGMLITIHTVMATSTIILIMILTAHFKKFKRIVID